MSLLALYPGGPPLVDPPSCKAPQQPIIYLYERFTCRYVRLNTLNVLHVSGPCFNAPIIYECGPRKLEKLAFSITRPLVEDLVLIASSSTDFICSFVVQLFKLDAFHMLFNLI